MAYRNFHLVDLQTKFNIVTKRAMLFPNAPRIEPSLLLAQQLERNHFHIRARTEKMVSEAFVFPILLEIQDRNSSKITLFSGENLLADKSKGLNGELDFLFAKQPDAYDLTAPIIAITEAKLDRALIKAANQCAAQMIGSQVFNHKNNQPVEIIYGAITNGSEWLFMKLEANILTLDETEYFANDLPKLLGVLQTIIDFYE